MVKILGLDIPPGLEEAFFRILGFANLTAENTLRSQKMPPSRVRVSQLANRSLMVSLEPTWDSFDNTRKTAWHDYWGGWPGSGYSAFIQINAPRIRDGLPLQLDPPGGYGPELLSNRFFTDNADGWTLDSCTYDDGAIRFQVNDVEEYAGLCSQALGTLENGMYRIEVTVRIPDGSTPQLNPLWTSGTLVVMGAGITTIGSGLYVGINSDGTDDAMVTLGGDVLYDNDPTTNGFAVGVATLDGIGAVLLETVSLRKIL